MSKSLNSRSMMSRCNKSTKTAKKFRKSIPLIRDFYEGFSTTLKARTSKIDIMSINQIRRESLMSKQFMEDISMYDVPNSDDECYF